MRVKFLATSWAPEYIIEGETVNGVDLSALRDIGEEERAKGIRAVSRENGVLHVVLCQMPPVSRVSKISDGRIIEHRSGDWRESGWIEADDYDPSELYIVKADVAPAPYIIE